MDGGEGSFQPQRSAMPTEESHPSSSTIFPESRLAHELLDGLEGLEIGPAAHNPFGLKTRNVGLAADRDPFDYEFFKQSQLEMCGSFAAIDISADAADIPVPDDSTDFVLHSHVWEHLPNPLIALDEWVRITRSGGYLFVIVPKRDAAASDKDRPVTSLPRSSNSMRRSDAAKLFHRKNAEWVEATTPSFLPAYCERLVIGSINRIRGPDSTKSLSRRPMTKSAMATRSSGR